MSERTPFELSQIPGLGPVRRAALEAAGVSDLEALLALKVAELAEIQGIGLWQARKIREYLRQQGLLVETEEGVALVISDAEDVAVVESAVAVLEERSEAEAELEAQVEVLADALAEREEEALAREAALTDEQAEVVSQADPAAIVTEEEDAKMAAEETGVEAPAETEPATNAETENVEEEPPTETHPETEEAFGTAPDAEALELTGRIGEQREQLPEITLALMESIRQAAVLPQLTRQITRLLITSGELVSSSKPLSPKKLAAASEALERAEQAVQQAVEKRTFSQTAQKELARRIRRRRKELEALLEEK